MLLDDLKASYLGRIKFVADNIELTGQPEEGSYVSIEGTTYKFYSRGKSEVIPVEIGRTKEETLENLRYAILWLLKQEENDKNDWDR